MHAIRRTPPSPLNTEARSPIPFTVSAPMGRELTYIAEALASGTLDGDGAFSRRCEQWLEGNLDTRRAMLTPSCTAALELAALLLDLAPGDEVIMPSFTFSSTANAFVLRGAVPVFVDVEPRTLNIDPVAVAAAVTSRTRAIVVVHYAGEACDMEAIAAVAAYHGLSVVEDAAQALLSEYRGQRLGTIGRFGCLSFHATKNVTTGHGGALMVNDARDVARAAVVRDRGTDREAFLRGQAPRYSWVDVGSSFYLSEILSAHLLAQLEQARVITLRRRAICAAYRAALRPLADLKGIRLPLSRPHQTGNGHIFFLLTEDGMAREALRAHLAAQGIGATFHYTPLHDSMAGRRYGRTNGALVHTAAASATILRLPVFPAMTNDDVTRVIAAVHSFYR